MGFISQCCVAEPKESESFGWNRIRIEKKDLDPHMVFQLREENKIIAKVHKTNS
jgi:hypothetical protein